MAKEAEWIVYVHALDRSQARRSVRTKVLEAKWRKRLSRPLMRLRPKAGLLYVVKGLARVMVM